MKLRRNKEQEQKRPIITSHVRKTVEKSMLKKIENIEHLKLSLSFFFCLN